MDKGGATTYIESLGVYLPANEVSSESRVAGIKRRVRVPLERFTGIQSTRRVSPGQFAIDLACRAIEASLEHSRFRAEDIGLLIACNISKYDREGFVFPVEPGTATSLRKALGFGNAIAFDLNNACAGMFTAILVADCFLHTTGMEAAVVVSGEYISHLADTAQREIRGLTDPRLACLTLGDSGAAVVLARSREPGAGFQDIELCTMGEHSSLCRGGPTGEAGEGAIMYTDSAELLRVGAEETARHFVDSIQKNGWKPETIDHVIPHQVSKGAPDLFVRQINSRLNGVKLARNKVIDNLAKRGNTATTTHFVALHDHLEKGHIGSRDQVVFSVTASGLTVGTALYVMDDLPQRRSNAVTVRSADPRQPNPPAPAGVSVAAVATTRSKPLIPASTEEIALEAAEACLARAAGVRDDIGVLLFSGVFKSGFVAEPSYASILAGKLFPSRTSRPILAFDLQQGPNGFLGACEILRTMMGRRRLRAGLVISAEFENNRLVAGYPKMGVAEIASAAVLTPPAGAGIEIGEFQFFAFEEYAGSFQADAIGSSPVHMSFHISDGYQEALQRCISKAVQAYVRSIGRTLADFDRFYFPQISTEFLEGLRLDLGLERERIVDVTIAGKDLFTSSLPCVLESAAYRPMVQYAAAGSIERHTGQSIGTRHRLSLAVSAGAGIHVGCAVVRGPS